MSFKILCKFVIAVLLMMAVLPAYASSIGVTPGRVTVDFVPSAKFDSQACFSTEGIPVLQIKVIGLLENYIEIEGLGPDGILDTRLRSSCIKYKVTLPENVDKPGVHYSGISAVEVPEETSGNIYALVRIIHQIFVVVPYPGKYLEITGFNVQNSDAGALVPITVNVENKGEEVVGSATGTVKVFDFQGKLLTTLSTNTAKEITARQSRVLSANWDSAGRSEGNYKATLLLVYDDLDANSSTNFKLGGLDLSLINHSSELIIGGIKPFILVVDSIWSEPITTAKANVVVFNLSGAKLQEFETLTKVVPAWSTVELQGYLDTDALGLGEFNAKIALYFEGLEKNYERKFKVVEPPKKVEPKQSFFKSYLTTRNVVIAMIVLLAIILILAAREILRKKKA